MIFRLFASLVLVWGLGFVAFGIFLPGSRGEVQTDAIVVPTGGGGRIARGLEMLGEQQSDKLLVTGVDPDVRPGEFSAQFDVSPRWMECCVTLGFDASDTRGNAVETAEWVEANNVESLRLVTNDWHMPRAAYELSWYLPDDVTVVEDAVPSNAAMGTLFLEYNKLLVSVVAHQTERF